MASVGIQLVSLLLFIFLLNLEISTKSLHNDGIFNGGYSLKQRNGEPLHIGAFNIQTFGRKKMAKPNVPEILVEILTRYDLVLLQELVDYSEAAIMQLFDMVNVASNDAYSMELSELQGRTTSKERYAFMYRHQRVSVVESYQWPDNEDYFERPPFSVRFKATNIDMDDFGFTGIHVRPSDAVSEIDKLTYVYDSMAQMWGLQDFIIGGDLNAGCRYVSSTAWKNISLRQQQRFYWAIGDDVDTTMAASSCPLDRFVLVGENMLRSFVDDAAVSYRFEIEMGLSIEVARNVSDHVPIDMYLN